MSSSDIAAYLFGPLDRKYCNYFYYISVVSYVFFIVTILAFLYMLLFSKTKNNFITMNLFSTIFSFFLAYFANRILYTMCQSSLK